MNDLNDFTDRKSVVAQLEKMYGRGSFYSKHFTDGPAGEIFFHNKTGFSIGHFLNNGHGYVTKPEGLQAKYLKEEK